MEIAFQDDGLRRLFVDSTFRIPAIAEELTKTYRRKMGIIVAAKDARDLYAVKSLHLEKLRGDRAGQHSIRLNDRWRLIVKLEQTTEGTTVNIIEIVDYH